MVPTCTNVALGIPSRKVKYSKFSVKRKYLLRFLIRPLPAPLPFLIGAFLFIVGILLLVGSLSKVGANQAILVLIVGILGFLPGFCHLLIAHRAYEGCQGYSYHDLQDCDD
uniref:Transmembrane protein 230 n=1 Tax=Equus asinus TaxID=9793 RepID=A0A8C4LQP6_EQUAS